MALERTLSIVKPDGVARNLIGQVYGRFEKAGLQIIAARMLHLSQAQAEGFYAVHKAASVLQRPGRYMTSGPVIAQVLEGENAVLKHRDLMGATDPKKAAPGTIRADLAESIEDNVVHGSDSAENAAIEIAYFFAPRRSAPANGRQPDFAMTDTAIVTDARVNLLGLTRPRTRSLVSSSSGGKAVPRAAVDAAGCTSAADGFRGDDGSRQGFPRTAG